jgi:hypothetical protein
MSERGTLRLHLWPEAYGVATLSEVPELTAWLLPEGPPVSLVVGHGEISVLAPETVIDALGDAIASHDRGWRALTFDAVFPLSTIGLLAAAARALAEVGVPVMVFSSRETDHFLVPGKHVGRTLAALGQARLDRFVSLEGRSRDLPSAPK